VDVDKKPSITIGESIYGGGDVGSTHDPYTSDLLMGNSSVHVNGQYTNISLAGSIMGSGNSCLTKGTKTADIYQFNDPVQMTGIHWFDEATVSSSLLDITGREMVITPSENKVCSLSHIGLLTLMDSSTIMIKNPAEDVGSYRSWNKDGKPTTSASPFNKIIFTSGSTLFIRSLNAGTSYEPEYGAVEGYTIISVADNAPYGGYILGSNISTGGFMVLKGGSYTIADKSDFEGNVKCWFISGVENKVATVSLIDNEHKTASTSVDIMKLQSKSKIMFTGGTYISSLDGYTFVTPSAVADKKISYTVGSMIEDQTASLVANEDQTYVTPTGYTIYGGQVFSETMAESVELKTGSVSGHSFTPVEDKDGVFTLNMVFTGIPDGVTNHLGYLMLYLQEVTEVTYTTETGPKTDYMVSSRIEVRVDLYTTGSTLKDSYTYKLNAVEGVGDVDLIFPAGLTNRSVHLLSINNNQGASASEIKVSFSLNRGNTTGWITVNDPIKYSMYNINDDITKILDVGTLSGGFMATLDLSVSDLRISGATYILKFVMKDSNGEFIRVGGEIFVITVTIYTSERDDVAVTFYDYQHGINHDTGGTTYSFKYGSTITEAQCAPVSENFLGWYTDEKFTNVFNFSTPLTKDTELYARYTHVVTFDYQDGTSSQLYVASTLSGVKIDPPSPPTKTGYKFEGWYKQSKCLEPWNFSKDTVDGNVTLYAKWVGVELRVIFTVTIGELEEVLEYE
jgi:uncharacterized repeat protein (TIGR02543 family)